MRLKWNDDSLHGISAHAGGEDRPRRLSVERWIAEARQGCRQALDRLLAACRPYLMWIANQEIAEYLRARVEPSDVVQNTLMEAFLGIPCFQGRSEADLLAWLRQILRNNMANESRRHLRTRKRSVSREVVLTEHTLAQLGDNDPASDKWPCAAALAREQDEALEQALRELPERFRQVLLLHTCEEMTFAQIGVHLHCSAEAARKLWARAADELANRLKDVR